LDRERGRQRVRAGMGGVDGSRYGGVDDWRLYREGRAGLSGRNRD